jgi:uncharacterized lipoprotein YehR (DUF1307 family)
MKITRKLYLILFAAVSLFSLIGCSNNPSPSTISSPVTTTTPVAAATTPTVASNNAPGVSFTADPNPIKVCDGSKLGITNLYWKAPGVKNVEIHVNAPDGPLMARGGAEGKAQTQKWVTNGMVFYLQDGSGTNTTTAQHTIATLTVNLLTQDCP